MSESLSTEQVAADVAAGPPSTFENLPFTTDGAGGFDGVLVPTGSVNMLTAFYIYVFPLINWQPLGALAILVSDADFAAAVAADPANRYVSGQGAVINLHLPAGAAPPAFNLSLYVGYV
jgi:hypothetical protein